MLRDFQSLRTSSAPAFHELARTACFASRCYTHLFAPLDVGDVCSVLHLEPRVLTQPAGWQGLVRFGAHDAQGQVRVDAEGRLKLIVSSPLTEKTLRDLDNTLNVGAMYIQKVTFTDTGEDKVLIPEGIDIGETWMELLPYLEKGKGKGKALVEAVYAGSSPTDKHAEYPVRGVVELDFAAQTLKATFQ